MVENCIDAVRPGQSANAQPLNIQAGVGLRRSGRHNADANRPAPIQQCLRQRRPLTRAGQKPNPALVIAAALHQDDAIFREET